MNMHDDALVLQVDNLIEWSSCASDCHIAHTADCVCLCEADCARFVTLCGEKVRYEKTTHLIDLSMSCSVAALQTRVFLKTKVVPLRQKIIGFKGITGALPPVVAVPCPSIRSPL